MKFTFESSVDPESLTCTLELGPTDTDAQEQVAATLLRMVADFIESEFTAVAVNLSGTLSEPKPK